jgi:hypothetical protein
MSLYERYYTSLIKQYITTLLLVWFEVFTVVTMKNGDPDEGRARFLRNIGSYKSHTA